MSEIRVDTISEKTSANGVAVDGVTIKDGNVGAAGTATSVAGIPLYTNDNSIYTHDVSGTDDTAQFNTAYGLTALDAITTGDKNIAIGYAALGASTTVAETVAIGHLAGGTGVGTSGLNVIVGNEAAEAVTSMSEAVVIGYRAAEANTTGSNMIAIGYQAYDAADTENHNLAIGSNALGGAVAGGEYNVAIGNYTLDALTSGDYNTAVGYNAGTDLTSGERNTFIGHEAGKDCIGGGQNVAIGDAAGSGALSTAAGRNVMIGRNSGAAITSGDSNNFIGFETGKLVTIASDNIAIGNAAFDAAVVERRNVAIGTAALGAHRTTASSVNDTGNTAVGYSAGSAITTGGNCLMLGHDAGTSNSIAQTTTESNRIILGDSNITDFFCADSSISSSDKRDKTDITDFSHGVNFIEQLQPKTYRWDKRVWYCDNYPTTEQVLAATPDGSKKKNKLNLGFMAQDVQAIEEALGYKTDDETNLIFHKNDAMQVSLKYERLIPILVNAIKELSTKVKALEDA